MVASQYRRCFGGTNNGVLAREFPPNVLETQSIQAKDCIKWSNQSPSGRLLCLGLFQQSERRCPPLESPTEFNKS